MAACGESGSMRPPRMTVVVVVTVFLSAIVAGWVIGQRGSPTDAGAESVVDLSSAAREAGSAADGASVPLPVDSSTTEPPPFLTETSVAPASSSQSTVPPSGEHSQAQASPPKIVAGGVVVAWQPSHQDDTGNDSWHEYQICGDIVERTISLLPAMESVLAWETGMGLTGSNNGGGTNRPAFDSELAKANEAGAQYFISVHNDGAAPSGILGMYFVGDEKSPEVAERLARAVSKGTGLPYRGLRGHDLYSLDPERNEAGIRILLEIGDNARDRAFLEDQEGRQRIAGALAAAVSGLEARK